MPGPRVPLWEVFTISRNFRLCGPSDTGLSRWWGYGITGQKVVAVVGGTNYENSNYVSVIDDREFAPVNYIPRGRTSEREKESASEKECANSGANDARARPYNLFVFSHRSNRRYACRASDNRCARIARVNRIPTPRQRYQARFNTRPRFSRFRSATKQKTRECALLFPPVELFQRPPPLPFALLHPSAPSRPPFEQTMLAARSRASARRFFLSLSLCSLPLSFFRALFSVPPR